MAPRVLGMIAIAAIRTRVATRRPLLSTMAALSAVTGERAASTASPAWEWIGMLGQEAAQKVDEELMSTPGFSVDQARRAPARSRVRDERDAPLAP